MKLVMDPMPMARAAMKERVNYAFAQNSNPHLDAAYAQKRFWAENDPEKLQDEALLRGVTTQELAALILSKPDVVADREAKRQRIMKQIDDAKTPQDLEQLDAR